MIYPEIPYNEKERQDEVNKYKNLNDLSKESYDNITTLIATICEVPIALISLIDNNKNIFKSNYGLKLDDSFPELSFCGHTITSSEEVMIINDSRLDERFCDNPFVLSGMAVFYAGISLVTKEGFKIGNLCVFDNKPRNLNDNQLLALKILAKQAMILFEKEFQNNSLNRLQLNLKNRNIDLEKFAAVVSHDLKSPLANIISLTKLLEDDNINNLKEDSLLYLKYLKSSSFSLRNYIEGILDFYKSDSITINKKESINLNELVEELKELLNIEDKVELTTQFQTNTVLSNKAALQQILLNLISNGLRYNSKNIRKIGINFLETESFLNFTVVDNGNGIVANNYDKIFELFTILASEDRYEEKGSGIGLASVKKVVENLGGTIVVSSIINVGSEFSFSIKK